MSVPSMPPAPIAAKSREAAGLSCIQHVNPFILGPKPHDAAVSYDRRFLIIAFDRSLPSRCIASKFLSSSRCRAATHGFNKRHLTSNRQSVPNPDMDRLDRGAGEGWPVTDRIPPVKNEEGRSPQW